MYQRLPKSIRAMIARLLFTTGGKLQRVGGNLRSRYSWAMDGTSQSSEPRETRSDGLVWVEVGACRGGSLRAAPEGSLVYAFEPNVALLADLIHGYPEASVIPAAVGERNGLAPFHFTDDAATGSLRAIDHTYVTGLLGADAYQETSTGLVPMIRLDTFMDTVPLSRIDVLVVDAQGADLAVLKSLGGRLADVGRIQVEAYLPGGSQYIGADNDRDAIVSFLTSNHFTLVSEKDIAFGTYVDLTFARSDLAT